MGERVVTAADGSGLFVRSFGELTERPAVVCIAGLTRNSRDFEAVAPDLAVDRMVLTLDLRGRGRSDADPTARSYTVATYADDVVGVLDAFGLDRVVVIGTSLGGLTAMWLGSGHPERVAGIVLNDIGPELQPEGVARVASYAGKLAPISTWEEAVAQSRFVSEEALPGLSDDEWLTIARQRYREAADGTVVIDHDAGITSGPAPTEDPWWIFDRLAGIPILVLRGATTDLLAPSTVETMKALHPGLVAVEVPDRGHAPTLEEPVARQALADFLASLS
ncbi:MAG TPA: alpha/beta hydrolase [Acidimicrobiales bacterium]